ncbi:MAG TPA: CPBP family intramembrane glutamic endopeptidase [Candidatus Limnocylindrales bacterium]
MASSPAMPAASPQQTSNAAPLVDPRAPRRLLVETLAVLFVTVGCAMSANLLSGPIVVPLGVTSLLLPLAYLVLEGRARHRTLADVGLRRHGFVEGVRSNGWLFVLVAVVLQTVPVALASLFVPDVLGHIIGRIPSFGDLLVLIPLVLVLTLREELVFRGLFQERVGWFVGQATAIAGVSALFALTHIAAGIVAVVAFDLLSVFADSLVFGAIYSRTRSVYVAWAAHAGADLVGLAVLSVAAAAT